MAGELEVAAAEGAAADTEAGNAGDDDAAAAAADLGLLVAVAAVAVAFAGWLAVALAAAAGGVATIALGNACCCFGCAGLRMLLKNAFILRWEWAAWVRAIGRWRSVAARSAASSEAKEAGGAGQANLHHTRAARRADAGR